MILLIRLQDAENNIGCTIRLCATWGHESLCLLIITVEKFARSPASSISNPSTR